MKAIVQISLDFTNIEECLETTVLRAAFPDTPGVVDLKARDGGYLEAEMMVLGAPLTIHADAFRTTSGGLEGSLRMMCEPVHAQEVASF